jgi:hypothetical protein
MRDEMPVLIISIRNCLRPLSESALVSVKRYRMARQLKGAEISGLVIALRSAALNLITTLLLRPESKSNA